MEMKFDAILGAFREVDNGVGGGSITVNTQISANSDNPVTSRAINAALNTKISVIEKGASNGVATLDENGKVPASQLPSMSGDGSSQSSNVCEVLFAEREWNYDDVNRVFVYAGYDNNWLHTGHIYRIDSVDNGIDIDNYGLCIAWGNGGLFRIAGVTGTEVKRAFYTGTYMNNSASLSYNEQLARWELKTGNDVVLYSEGNTIQAFLTPYDMNQRLWRFTNGFQPELFGVQSHCLQYESFMVSGISDIGANGTYTFSKYTGSVIEFTGNKVDNFGSNYWTLKYGTYNGRYSWLLSDGYGSQNCVVYLNNSIDPMTGINAEYLNSLSWFCDENEIGTPSFTNLGFSLGKYKETNIEIRSTDITPNLAQVQ